MSIRHLIIAFCLSFAVLTPLYPSGALAQVPIPASAPDEGKTAAALPEDTLGRLTPRGTFRGFIKAVSAEDFTEAAEYLDLSKLSGSKRAKGADYARNLQMLLDRQGRLQPDGMLSDSPEGNTNDELGDDIDYFAGLRTKEGMQPIYVQRVDVDGKKLWLISAEFVKQIPTLVKNVHKTPIDAVIGDRFSGYKFYGAQLTHWAAMIGFYLFAYVISGILVRLLIRGGRRLFRRRNRPEGAVVTTDRHLIDAFQTPLRLYAMVLIAMFGAAFVGIETIVRHVFMPISLVIGWIAIGLFLWRLAEVLTTNFERRMATRGRHSMSSLLAFTRRAVKFLLVVIIGILILDSFGVDVTAGLAALGIGGIALALGAQKTLENFIGSLSIIADQPFYIGDFCKIGDTSGTVEDIGMRSTRIRTNDRTLVTIPNGDLSTQRIENYARRPRQLFNKKMILRYDAKSEQIREFVRRAEALIAAQPKIAQEGKIVRMNGFVETGYLIEIWCYVESSDFALFVDIVAEVTYGLIDAAWDIGVYFAIPSQTFVPAVDQTGKPVEVEIKRADVAGTSGTVAQGA